MHLALLALMLTLTSSLNFIDIHPITQQFPSQWIQIL